MRARELQCKLSDIDPLFGAKLSRLACSDLNVLWLSRPNREGSVGEQASRKRPRVHGSYPFCLECRNTLVHIACVLKGVLIVGHHTIEFGLIADHIKYLKRITANSNESNLPRILNLAQCRNRFIDDLLQWNKLDVMAQDDIQIVCSHTLKTDIYAFNNTLC